jgi:stage III sporulation protein SpoIIIAA
MNYCFRGLSRPPPGNNLQFCISHFLHSRAQFSISKPRNCKDRYSIYSNATTTQNLSSAATFIGAADDVERLVAVLPDSVRLSLAQHGATSKSSLVEVVMDLGRPPLARFQNVEGKIYDVRLSEDIITADDIASVVTAVGEFGGDNRAGLDATLHRISAIRNRRGGIVGLTCRIGRAIRNSADLITDLIRAGKSILLLGSPGVGKTTTLREVCRMMADECHTRVVIVDTSNEIAGDGDTPSLAIGKSRRMQVPTPEEQHRVMIEAVENHMPEAIVIDEIGTEAEAQAARTIAQRGVVLVATAHGTTLENLIKNVSLNDLVGGITAVTLGDDEAKRRGVQKTVMERAAPCTFDVAVEMRSRHRWRIHHDLASAVDKLLLGEEVGAEVREIRPEDGRIFCWKEESCTDTEDDDDDNGDIRRKKEQRQLNKGSRKGRVIDILETQPFPPEALRAARGGLVVQREEEEQPQQQQQQPQQSKVKSLYKDTILPPGSAMKVYCFGVDGNQVTSTAALMTVDNAPKPSNPSSSSSSSSSLVVVVEKVQEADCILATRGKIKSSTWIKEAAKIAKIPLFTIQTDSEPNIVRAVRTLMGLDPSPGGVFRSTKGGSNKNNSEVGDKGRKKSAKKSDDDSSGRSSSGSESSSSSPASSSASWSSSNGGVLSSSPAAIDALEEARLAIDNVVITLGEAVELLPRDPAILEIQMELVEKYNLQVQVVGTLSSGVRLRVLPMGGVKDAVVKKKNKTTTGVEFW